MRSLGSVMKKLRRRKIPNGSAKAVWMSQIGMNVPPSPVCRMSCDSGMKVICAGISSIAITTRKRLSRKGKRTHAKPKAASAAIKSGRIVAGTVIDTLFRKALSMFCCWSTC